MKKLTRKQYHELFAIIAARDGLYCFVGQEPGTSESLFVDIWDCDTTNLDPSNLRLLCRDAQLAKSPWLHRKGEKVEPSNNMYMCVSEDERMTEPLQTKSLELVKNLMGEPAFKHWLFREMVGRGRILLKEVLDSGAVVARLSQETIKRYLFKETSPTRLYMLTQESRRYVRFKPEWEAFRKVLEERKKNNAEASAMIDKVLMNVGGVERRYSRKKLNDSTNAKPPQLKEENRVTQKT